MDSSLLQNVILIESREGLQPSFIGILGSLIAILFSILITIVSVSSNKYPSNFIEKISKDQRTRRFYIFLVSIIIFQSLLYFLKISSPLLDVLCIGIVFFRLFNYWKYILEFIDPINSIKKISLGDRLSKKEIGELGDYAKIGLENKNHELTDKAMRELSRLNERLKNE
ncbi:MAG: hypothetical protein AABX99_04040 [Nanoarchaeota archaeon]